MVLSDRSIKDEMAKGELVIRPSDEACIQPASVDLHLGGTFRAFKSWHFPYHIDLRQALDSLTEVVDIERDHNFALAPGQFVLGTTTEYIALPDYLVGRLEGKSSLGRVGLLVHATAGYVDPGWRGHLTLELHNVCTLPILLYPGMKISHISFQMLTTPADRPYGAPGLGSKYMEQVGPTPTRYHEEFRKASLLSTASIPRKNVRRRDTRERSNLKGWLDESEFNGSVGLFSKALGAPSKTVEDWVYKGVRPGQSYRRKLYSLTQLAEFGSPEEATPRLNLTD